MPTVSGTKTVQLATGTVSSLAYTQLGGSGTLTLEGNWTEATATTGVTSGTAGAGSNTTTLNKPAAAANWTANDLRGKYLRITSGGGSGAIRPIISNTTTAITVHAISGMDATSVFTISTPNTTVTTLSLTGCHGAITLKACNVTTSLLQNCGTITLENCTLTSLFSASHIAALNLTGCHVSSSFTGTISYSQDLNVTNCTSVGGRWIAANCDDALLKATATACSGYAWQVQFCKKALMELDANTNTAIPLVLEGIDYFAPTGNGLTGTNAGAAHGISISKAGYYDLTGSTLAGAADLSIDGTTVTYATLISYTSVIKGRHQVFVT